MPTTLAPWDPVLTNLLEYAASTTAAGAPEPCEPRAFYALSAFAECMNHHLPVDYLRFLGRTNGLSIKGVVDICGLGIPPMDDHGRSDFLLVNQKRSISGRMTGAKTTAFGTVQDTYEIVWDSQRRLFAIRSSASGDDLATYEDFSSLMTAVLQSSVGSLLAAA